MTVRTHSRKYYFCGAAIVVLVALVIAARLYLGVWLLGYVNQSLNNIDHYKGSVQSIDIDLYRGAYRIHGLRLDKEEGKIPTPFVVIDTVDLSLQWSALLHGRVVSNIDLEKPVINFAVSKSGSQTGTDVDWTKPIKNLMPIDINHVTFRNGLISYQDFASSPQVDIYIHHMSGEVRNLRNVVNKSQPLPSVVVINGDSIGNGELAIKGRMNILKQVPDMDLYAQLENVPLPALNSYSNAYAALDFKGGTINIYSEFRIKDKRLTGYVKPIAKNISLINLNKEANPIKVVWEGLVSTIITIFTNHHQEQFATRVDLEGSLDNINTDTWSAIGGIIHNAFISAMKRGFDTNTDDHKTLDQAAPSTKGDK